MDLTWNSAFVFQSFNMSSDDAANAPDDPASVEAGVKQTNKTNQCSTKPPDKDQQV